MTVTTCYTCDGKGIIVTCCDDMCVGLGHCMHGDGEMVCPSCHGEGTFDDYYDDQWDIGDDEWDMGPEEMRGEE